MASTSEISAAQWLRVRDRIASVLGNHGSTQLPTRRAMAEGLMALGYVDVDTVVESITAKPAPKPEEPIAGLMSDVGNNEEEEEVV